MDVILEAIKFNHDPTGATTGAFNIRRSERKSVSIPEWIRGKSKTPQDSSAAYALDKIKQIPFNIQAMFRSLEGSPSTFRIKALLEQYAPESDSGIASGSTISPKPTVLGETGETEVVLSARQSGFETFTLKNPRIGESGVGVRDISWRWQYRTPSNDWTDFELTHHRIYTVVTIPKLPWEPGSSMASDTQVPWTDVLDFACRWAATATTVDEAAAEVTRKVTALGHDGLLHYDDPNSGAINFTQKRPFMFDCSDFLRVLAGHKNWQGRKVNCDDCAAIVVTFANILGCDLNEGEMGVPAFRPKAHLRIGLPSIFGGQFSHHTVAWKGACLQNNRLFDACLQLNSVRNQTAAPRWFVPINILFGDSKQEGYRTRLALKPEDCTPQGIPRRRRIGHLKPRPGSRARLLSLSQKDPFVSMTIRKKEAFNWRVTNLRLIETDEALYFLQSFWKHKIRDNAALGIDAYECDSPKRARKLMKTILSTFQLTEIAKNRINIGDAGFSNSARYAIVFVRGSFVFRFRNTGDLPVACDDFARFVDELILSKF